MLRDLHVAANGVNIWRFSDVVIDVGIERERSRRYSVPATWRAALMRNRCAGPRSGPRSVCAPLAAGGYPLPAEAHAAGVGGSGPRTGTGSTPGARCARTCATGLLRNPAPTPNPIR